MTDHKWFCNEETEQIYGYTIADKHLLIKHMEKLYTHITGPGKCEAPSNHSQHICHIFSFIETFRNNLKENVHLAGECQHCGFRVPPLDPAVSQGCPICRTNEYKIIQTRQIGPYSAYGGFPESGDQVWYLATTAVELNIITDPSPQKYFVKFLHSQLKRASLCGRYNLITHSFLREYHSQYKKDSTLFRNPPDIEGFEVLDKLIGEYTDRDVPYERVSEILFKEVLAGELSYDENMKNWGPSFIEFLWFIYGTFPAAEQIREAYMLWCRRQQGYVKVTSEGDNLYFTPRCGIVRSLSRLAGGYSGTVGIEHVESGVESEIHLSRVFDHAPRYTLKGEWV